jgi:hypothetical protein
MWGMPSLDALVQDVLYAWRTMRRAPGFAAITCQPAARRGWTLSMCSAASNE